MDNSKRSLKWIGFSRNNSNKDKRKHFFFGLSQFSRSVKFKVSFLPLINPLNKFFVRQIILTKNRNNYLEE
ncbi:hypothetical protein JOC86_003143 [Bacillus pakistanensis]|uniref:Uncharacterized protein n=1 Tax=Rossellomorea pakistanensis TaxID=992288 RepID=A0ABS2NFF2_9BACI|nr:hypothetical protein [Bacillus pakistanensis]